MNQTKNKRGITDYSVTRNLNWNIQLLFINNFNNQTQRGQEKLGKSWRKKISNHKKWQE